MAPKTWKARIDKTKWFYTYPGDASKSMAICGACVLESFFEDAEISLPVALTPGVTLKCRYMQCKSEVNA